MQPGLHVVKRIIGVPGDRIRVANGIVYRNGERLNEPYVIHSVKNYDRYRDEFPSVSPRESSVQVATEWFLTQNNYIKDGEITVPPDSYFGMGDNRDVSWDSRYWGFIPRENVFGRPSSSPFLNRDGDSTRRIRCPNAFSGWATLLCTSLTRLFGAERSTSSADLT